MIVNQLSCFMRNIFQQGRNRHTQGVGEFIQRLERGVMLGIILAQDLGYVFGHCLVAEKHAFSVRQSVGQDGYTFLADPLRHV
jgi:hypothetical protein